MLRIFAKIIKILHNIEFGAVQRNVNLVDLEKCWKMRIWTQKSASIQKKTSPLKFDNFAEKSEKDTVSYLSSKAMTRPNWLLRSSRQTPPRPRGRWLQLSEASAPILAPNSISAPRHQSFDLERRTVRSPLYRNRFWRPPTRWKVLDGIYNFPILVAT